MCKETDKTRQDGIKINKIQSQSKYNLCEVSADLSSGVNAMQVFFQQHFFVDAKFQLAKYRFIYLSEVIALNNSRHWVCLFAVINNRREISEPQWLFQLLTLKLFMDLKRSLNE